VKKSLTDMIRSARAVSTPLIGVTTTEPAEAMAQIGAALLTEHRLYSWDIVRGISPANEAARDAESFTDLCAAIETSDLAEFAQMTQNPVMALTAIRRAPLNSAIVMHNAHRILDNHAVAQAIWNLRDNFKSTGSTLILLAPQLQLPAELQHDMMIFDDPLPDDDRLGEIVTEIHVAAGLDFPTEIVLRRAVDALRGLSPFEAEQCTALSITRDGLNFETLWERKRRAVEQTPGLRFFEGGAGYDTIGGLRSLKELAYGLFRSSRAPRVIVFIDEIEKWASGIMGSSGNNGVDKDAFSVVLREIAEHAYRGLTIVGPAGTGKTVFARATAAEFNVPLLEMDLGEAKGRLMGESQAKVRSLWKTVHALAGDGGALIVCAANGLPDDVPQELRRRIAKLGTYFVDLPSSEERAAIWTIQRKKYGIDPADYLPSDDNWTGADIEGCCDLADSLEISLVDAAKRLVPIARSQPETINRLRKQASGRWQSANEIGTYVMPSQEIAVPTGAGRRLQLPEDTK